jgi:Uma2 family endonuclease
MNVTLTPARKAEIDYPSSDGKPLADNTKQARWIILLDTALAGLFRRDKDVFVAADLNWYPVEGEPIVNAPDVLVAFGRPKGDRPSYKQWEEDGVAPQVVFEILSPGNDVFEMARKLQFYDDYGVEEYYLYDPRRTYWLSRCEAEWPCA